MVRDNGTQNKVLSKRLTWKEGWIIYSEITGKKGTVELSIEGNARDGAQRIYIFSHNLNNSAK